MRKRIYIAYTGGTIGMRRTNEGTSAGAKDDMDGSYEPVPDFLQQEMATISAFQHPLLPAYTIHQYDPLLDSPDMTPADWSAIARDICRNYGDYDGFIVLHGTDTMAYTASALAFMLEGLDKPVILTGSQIPLCELRNDAQDNLITTLILAAADDALPEVCLYFDNRLLRGCRSVKVHATGFNAFASPNFPALATVGAEIEINHRLERPSRPSGQGMTFQPITRPEVGALRLFPGISADVLENMLRPPLRGLVLETYGTGNAPTRDKQLLAVLTEATARGVVIVDCTQCLRGTVSLHKYATGAVLARAGVISGYDMTAEAALTKLAYLFSKHDDPSLVKREMQRDLRGELTATTSSQGRSPARP